LSEYPGLLLLECLAEERVEDGLEVAERHLSRALDVHLDKDLEQLVAVVLNLGGDGGACPAVGARVGEVEAAAELEVAQHAVLVAIHVVKEDACLFLGVVHVGKFAV